MRSRPNYFEVGFRCCCCCWCWCCWWRVPSLVGWSVGWLVGLVGLVWFGRFGLVGLVWFGRFGRFILQILHTSHILHILHILHKHPNQQGPIHSFFNKVVTSSFNKF